MQPWRKKKGLRRSEIQTVLDPIEREAMGDIIAAVVEAIIARAQSAPKDELAEMMDMPSGHKEAPDDPALARLFPDFQREGDEEYDGDRSRCARCTKMTLRVPSCRTCSWSPKRSTRA